MIAYQAAAAGVGLLAGLWAAVDLRRLRRRYPGDAVPDEPVPARVGLAAAAVTTLSALALMAGVGFGLYRLADASAAAVPESLFFDRPDLLPFALISGLILGFVLNLSLGSRLALAAVPRAAFGSNLVDLPGALRMLGGRAGQFAVLTLALIGAGATAVPMGHYVVFQPQELRLSPRWSAGEVRYPYTAVARLISLDEGRVVLMVFDDGRRWRLTGVNAAGQNQLQDLIQVIESKARVALEGVEG